MTQNQKIEEIISMLSFLQLYIKNNTGASFTDLSFSLETAIMDFFNVFEKKEGQFINANAGKHNYPAIDLHNKKGIAIQVTTTADAAKRNKTIETYNKHGLNYKQLLIVGFVTHTKSSKGNAQVVGIDYLINKVKHASAGQLDRIHSILTGHIPLNVLHPTDDKLAFEVSFRVINRSAVRDMTAMEGDFDHMIDGLKEVKQIITSGEVKGKSIRAKTLAEYSQPTQDKLADIEHDVSSIIRIVNTARNRHPARFISLTPAETGAIDRLKQAIIDKTNKLALDLGSKSKIK